MANENNPNSPPLTPGELAELQLRFPRAAWWAGLLPQHPEYHRMQQLLHGAGPAGQPAPGLDLAPQQPYMPPPGPPPAYAAPPQQQGLMLPPAPVHVPNIDVSVPLNTGVVGGIISRVTIRLPTNISFVDFFSRVIARMDLDPLTARIAYKYATDRVRDPAHQLSNEDELRRAMEKGLSKIRLAHTREVVLEIHNLEPAQQAAAGCKRTIAESSTGDSNQPDTVVSFKTELRELKQKLACQKHAGKHCYVDATGAHQQLDIYQLTLWAKKILFKKASFTSPPSNSAFDHVAKKPRKSQNGSGTSIEIHNHLGEVLPLGDRGGQRRVNTSSAPTPPPVDEADEAELVRYPHISDALAELHTVMPRLNYPRYEEALTNHGLVYVNGVYNVDTTFFTDVIGIPAATVHDLVTHAKRLAIRAKKGKGRAID